MKKLVLVLQILVLFSQSVRAENVAIPQTSVTTSTEVVAPQMPKNYKLPNMQLLDSVAFYNRYKDQHGKRVDVEGITGRFGATFGDGFKKQIYEIERQANENVEIILTLTSTMADAKILKERMALSGRKMVIVEIPDHVQEKILHKAEIEAATGIKQLWLDTKDKVGKLLNIGEVISDSKKIIKNQFVPATKRDMGLVWVSVTSTVVTTALLITVGSVDPTLALSLGVMRALIGATALAYHKTLTNVFKSDLFNEFNIISTPRRAITRLTVMGLGLGEFYYLLGSSLAGSAYGLTQKQLFTNTYTSGLVESLSSEERNNRLSEKANHRMIIGHIIIGAAISSAAIVGKTGPLLYSNSFIEVTSLLAGTLVLYSGFYVAYRYFSRHFEKIAQNDLVERAYTKWQRLLNIRQAHKERLDKERLEAVKRRDRMLELMRFTMDKPSSRNAAAPMCAGLFQ